MKAFIAYGVSHSKVDIEMYKRTLSFIIYLFYLTIFFKITLFTLYKKHFQT